MATQHQGHDHAHDHSHGHGHGHDHEPLDTRNVRLQRDEPAGRRPPFVLWIALALVVIAFIAYIFWPKGEQEREPAPAPAPSEVAAAPAASDPLAAPEVPELIAPDAPPPAAPPSATAALERELRALASANRALAKQMEELTARPAPIPGPSLSAPAPVPAASSLLAGAPPAPNAALPPHFGKPEGWKEFSSGPKVTEYVQQNGRLVEAPH